MDFKNFDDSAKQKILSLQNQDESIYKNYFASDITVQMFFSWIDCDKPQYIDCDDFLLVKKNTEKNGFFFAPVASTPQNFKKGLEYIKNYGGENAVIGLVPEEFMQYVSNDWMVEENINAAEYLYLPEDLIFLKGKHFHQKRNFVNRFITSYPYIFRSYEQQDENAVLKMVEDFYIGKIDEFGEYDAVKKTLADLTNYNYFCDCIYSDSNLVAFSITYINPANVGVIIFEKAHVDYIGSYAALNNFTSKKRFSSCRLISMQDDMGLENLKKAKESYHPYRKERKFTLTLKK